MITVFTSASKMMAGFDTATKKAGIGLENIKRRAYILGGETKIISSPGNGCEVSVQIPLNG
jgi:signal transduction histidine kinase